MKLKSTLLILSLTPMTLMPQPEAQNGTNINDPWPVEVTLPADNQKPTTSDETQQSIFESRWGTCKTILAGALVGSTFGMLNYATDDMWPLNWVLFWSLRDTLVKDILDNADRNSESVNESMLTNFTWTSDWIAYLVAYKIMVGRTPWTIRELNVT